MTTYVDSSVVLRVILKSAGAFDWGSLDLTVSSVLLQVECLRTLDRMVLTGEIKKHEHARSYAALHESMDRINLLKITDDTIAFSGQSFGHPLKTLDAIHLATALEWRNTSEAKLLFATHDTQLATAARAAGFEVLGGA